MLESTADPRAAGFTSDIGEHRDVPLGPAPKCPPTSSPYDRGHQAAGSPFPRGANWDGKGVNFSLFSESSESVELCLFDADGGNEERIRIRERTNGAWHIYIPGVGPGQLYGYRVYGPYVPESGLRFNPNKLLAGPLCEGDRPPADLG
jgi:pullulanase/glycogen debranching enzyme